MTTEKFTNKSYNIFVVANELALKYGHHVLLNEHILLSLIGEPNGIVPTILNKMGIEVSVLIDEVKKRLNNAPKMQYQNNKELVYSDDVNKIVEIAENYMKKYGDSYISVEHLFLASLDKNTWLKDFGVIKNNFENILKELRGTQKVNSVNYENSYEVLEKYGRDLVLLAKEGKLDPVIGRDDEIRRTIQILLRKTKNNPVIIGEPRIGKTAIVEGIAIRILKGDVPEGLKDKTIFVLDMGALIAGAKYQGNLRRDLNL